MLYNKSEFLFIISLLFLFQSKTIDMKCYLLIGLFVLSFSFLKAQNVIVENTLGKFYVKWMGKGNWDDQKNKATNIGYRLPTPKEFDYIMGKTSAYHPLWRSLKAEGWSPDLHSCYYWTSMDNNETWADAIQYTHAVVIWWGDWKDDGNSKSKPVEKSWNYGCTIVVKKVR